MTKSEILGKVTPDYTGEPTYTISEALQAMDDFAQQQVAKERDKAKKLVEALGSAISTLEGLEMYNTCETIKQSLTEYEL